MIDNNSSSKNLFLGHRISLEKSDKKNLGNFYLPIQDLLTHIFICGVTGSGKTVFGKAIVEELALKGIPSILIDLKGDLSSLSLLFDSPSEKYFTLYTQLCTQGEGNTQNSREKAEKKFENHLKQLNKFGLSANYIRKLKESVEVVIFTPRSGRGIPLAISSLANPPENIHELYDQEPETVLAMIDSLVNSLVDRLYPDERLAKREKERKFLSEILLYAWLNEVKLEGLQGLVRLIELVENPPIKEVGILPLNEYIQPKQRKELAQKLNGLLVGAEQLWYKGVPLDIDLLSGKHRKTNKTQISIINLTELDSFDDRCFVVSRIAYSIYNWMKKQGGASSPRLIFYIDEIGGGGGKRAFYPSYPFHVVSKPAIDLLLRQGRAFGVCCIFATQNPGDVNYKGLSNCGTWVVGKLSTKRDRDKILEGISEADIKFDRIDELLTSPDNGEFLIKLRSGEVVLVKERWLASFHCTLSPLFLSKVLSQEVKEGFRAFYLPDRIPGQKWFSKISTKPMVLTPEAIFENFNFGVGHGELFVLDVEPEEAIRMCLQELAKEGISPNEIQFKNAQLMIVRVHRADWNIDKVIHNSQGNVIDHIKDSGIYSRFDAPLKLSEEIKKSLTEMVQKSVNPRSLEICKKIEVLLPDSNRLTKTEVRSQIIKKINVPSKDIQVLSIKEQNIAIAYKFTMEYREKSIECYIDVINHEIKVNFPIFSKEEAINEVKKLHPDFQIDGERVFSEGSVYIVNYNTEDYNYTFKVSKKSCKILRKKMLITEKRAKQIARERIGKEPFSIWKHGNTWNLYYLDGTRLIIDEENENVITKRVISSEQAETLAINKLTTTTDRSDFSIVKKEFKNGKWLLNLESEKWLANLQVDENGEIIQNLRLQQTYCFGEAKKILERNKIPDAKLVNSNVWNEGWEFVFVSSLGRFKVRVGEKKKEFLKERLTQEGAVHFVQLELGGEIIAIKDKVIFWDIILNKQDRNYRVRLNKKGGEIEIRLKKFIFWKKININDVKKNTH